MFYWAFLLIAWNLFGPDSGFSAFGSRLVLDDRPWSVRMRWLGGGMLLCLFLSGTAWDQPGWLGWSSLAVLAIGSTRRRLPMAQRPFLSES